MIIGEPPTFHTYPANNLIWVKLTERSALRHPVGSIELPDRRTAIHPVTYPLLNAGAVWATHSLVGQWFVTDLPTGQLLPILSFDTASARSVAGSWVHHVTRGLVNPHSLSSVMGWAEPFVARYSPSRNIPTNVRVQLIHDMQWPPNLPPSQYTPN